MGIAHFGWEIYIRLLVAMLMGAIIGFERAWKLKPAGVRTHSLVCLGSALWMIISNSSTGPYQDHMRVAAQIVSGIGFLGAGVIWFDPHHVARGLTTAANLWVTAALGVVIGLGYYDISLWVGLLMLVAINAPRFLAKLGLLPKGQTEFLEDTHIERTHTDNEQTEELASNENHKL